MSQREPHEEDEEDRHAGHEDPAQARSPRWRHPGGSGEIGDGQKDEQSEEEEQLQGQRVKGLEGQRDGQ
jgi:hypothetical protein